MYNEYKANCFCLIGISVHLMSEDSFIRTIIGRFASDRPPDRTPPFEFVDDRDRTIQFRSYRAADFDSLVAMYRSFDSTNRAQGVPPLQESAIQEWLSDILEGPNLLARHRDRTVGHVSFVPDGTDRHELAIFVHQEYQRAGIGTTLLATGLEHAKRNGVTYVWLSVGKSSRELHQFYARAGFSVVNPLGVTYRMSRYL